MLDPREQSGRFTHRLTLPREFPFFYFGPSGYGPRERDRTWLAG
jgi:hypothetical protein